MRFLPCVLIVVSLPCTSVCQSPTSPFLNALKAQSSSSALQHSLTINGTAEWRAGSLDETGPATLVARSDGSFETDLVLTTARRQDTFGPLASRSCQRTQKDGKQVSVSGANCYTPLPWFSPSVLPVLLSNPALIITDGGQQAEKGSMKHLVSVNNRFGPSNRPEQVAILSSMAVTIFVSV